MVILLISVYIGLFLNCVYAGSMRECMKRYFTLVYELQDYQVVDYIDCEEEPDYIADLKVKVICGRSWDQ